MKTIEQSFIDWEASVFGFGYGTGEPHTLAALKTFMAAVGCEGSDRRYDYQKLEAACGPQVAWLLINTLCKHHVDIIEYGTSPRYGWLTDRGIALRDFLATKTVDDLVDLVCDRTEDDVICYPDSCNCGPNGWEKGRKCLNPFWVCR